MIIEKNNLIVKLDNQGVLKDASSRTKGVILVDRFNLYQWIQDGDRES